MLKVKIISIGKWKEDWLKLAIDEYEKRLRPQLEFTWVYPKNDLDLIHLISLETNPILLDPRGILMDSLEFSQKLNKIFETQGSRASFVIGGPNGFPPELSSSYPRWSLSRLTFTHQITRLILVEQIYRALEISKKSPYHK